MDLPVLKIFPSHDPFYSTLFLITILIYNAHTVHPNYVAYYLNQPLLPSILRPL